MLRPFLWYRLVVSGTDPEAEQSRPQFGRDLSGAEQDGLLGLDVAEVANSCAITSWTLTALGMAIKIQGVTSRQSIS